MTTLFNDDWHFAEFPLENNNMYKDGKAILYSPKDFYDTVNTLIYKPVRIPHDWMIWHVKELYKNSVGSYKKEFNLEDCENKHISVRFEGVYMNCAVWINGQLAGEWKYGYATFEFDISEYVKKGKNTIQLIAVYQNCNTRWYSGAGIIRDTYLSITEKSFLTPDGTYFVSKLTDKNPNASLLNGKWSCNFSTEVCSPDGNIFVKTKIVDKENNILWQSPQPVKVDRLSQEEEKYLNSVAIGIKNQKLYRAKEVFTIDNPILWDVENPYLYKTTSELLDPNGNIIDSYTQYTGFKTAIFDKEKGFFLNGRHLKILGACHHHDQGALGAAFDKNALRRQFNKLKEMGVNSVRCSHNPPPKAWMDLADEMGILIDDEAFDMWEKPKTQFDYGNYFNQWCEKDTVSWVRKDRNHPCLIMWSIGNEIYDTHIGNGLAITKKLSEIVKKHDPLKNALITIASNYMMTDGAQECAKEIELVGYNYLERLYEEHHEKYKDLPNWIIYGSETGSTVQSRGIYHFPDTLKLVTFSDMQCSTLGNCTTTWGCANTQTVITNDRDCPYSAGQYIWTGWDYIGEPTPYHSKNSYFGQIDTAGFPKDTFYLYKSEWAYKNTEAFVHILPYWDWNEGQIIDVKVYSNTDSLELFLNGESLGKQDIDHIKGMKPFGQWQLPYKKGELKAVGYDKDGKIIASEIKKSFGDPHSIILEAEENPHSQVNANGEELFFVDIMTADKEGCLVENARNYITINVSQGAELVGMDNGDSTDYDEYVSFNGHTHSRKLFNNRLVAIIRAKSINGKKPEFTITGVSKDLQACALKFKDGLWSKVQADSSILPEKDFIPTRKIEISVNDANGKINLSKEKPYVMVSAKVLPENASIKKIEWNPVLKECVSSDYIQVTELKEISKGVEEAKIVAACDGECILRITANNGLAHNEILSDLNFTVSGVGNPKLNPYKLIEACRLDGWDKSKEKPVVSLESGISNRNLGETWISFDKVDFGNQGADSIHIPIFSFDTELPFEVWDGTPENGKCILQGKYKHESIYNTFSENIFTLERRLFGVHTISILFKTELVFHGFYFDESLKAISKLSALDANDIVGDSFTKTDFAVEGIGNNVNLDFTNMNFPPEGASKITICGKSNTENNTINIKFFDEDSSVSTQVIDFAHTDDYEEKTFDLEKITGNKKVSFVFLPGCNFDFKWFKFE